MILAITPFTGSKKLVEMTADCLRQLSCSKGLKEIEVVAVNNGATANLDDNLDGMWVVDDELCLPKNIGFGPAVNAAIDSHLRAHTDVLVFNNDLQFPDVNWLRELLNARDGSYVLSPCTDITATQEALADKAMDKPPFRLAEVSAFCWLVPTRCVRAVKERFGFWLFPPQFPNYGSDDAAAAVLRMVYGRTPFKIVPRSWVKHLKARTANELGVKAGTEQLLRELKKWKQANKLK